MQKKSLNSVLGVILGGILSILLGLVLILWPDIAGKVACYALGGLVLVFAVIRIVSFFLDKKVYFTVNFDLIIGLVAAAIGIYMLIQPEVILRILPVITGLFLLISGILDCQKTYLLKQYGNDHWKISLVLAILKLLVSAFMLASPLFIAYTVIWLIGACLVFNGVTDIWIVARWPKNPPDAKVTVE